MCEAVVMLSVVKLSVVVLCWCCSGSVAKLCVVVLSLVMVRWCCGDAGCCNAVAMLFVSVLW